MLRLRWVRFLVSFFLLNGSAGALVSGCVGDEDAFDDVDLAAALAQDPTADADPAGPPGDDAGDGDEDGDSDGDGDGDEDDSVDEVGEIDDAELPDEPEVDGVGPCADPALCVVEVSDPSAAWGCDELGGSPSCVDDYLALAESEAGPGVDLAACAEALTAWTQQLIAGEDQIADVAVDGAEDLANKVLDALTIDDWLMGLDERPLQVTYRDSEQVGDVMVHELLFEDPIVGTFQARLALPSVEGTLPAVLALPGHPLGDDQTWDFLETHHGLTYAEAGYAVLVVSFRGYDSAVPEHLATSHLVCAGRSLVAVKHYEALLAFKYLRWLQQLGVVDGVGLVGHSGGSTAGNPLVRYQWDFDAWVTDNATNYLNVQPCPEQGEQLWCVIDETMPSLTPIHLGINDTNLTPSVVPWLEQEYGYPNGPDATLGFLDAHVR